MNKPMYIKAASAISPQHSYGEAPLLEPVMSSDAGCLFIVDQDYRKYISPVAIRRMSKLLKMSITAGMKCLDDAGVQPDAIITGTGKGSVSDMEHFLQDMINLKEEALNPTYFIQSTYNSVNGWLALQTKCTSYNQTFVNRGLSFELALLDAQLSINEAGDIHNILVGGFDELTEQFYHVKKKVGYWKQEQINSCDLLNHNNTPGTIGGEGASFFVLSNDNNGAVTAIKDIQLLYKPGAKEMQAAITSFLERNSIGIDNIDVLLSGMNGNAKLQPVVDSVLNMLPAATAVAAFKHLSGDFDTASGFGLWMANHIMATQNVPEAALGRRGEQNSITNMLMVNHSITGDGSLTLLQSA